jgi:hypothetical protein
MPSKKSKRSSKKAAVVVPELVSTKIAKLAADARALLVQVHGQGWPAMTADERLHTTGKIREGEAVAMVAVLDTMDAFPGVFQSLAAHDGGVDPDAVETEPSRDAVAQGLALQVVLDAVEPLREAVEDLEQCVSDAVMASFARAKEVTLPAYVIGKASATNDAALRRRLAPALDFYGALVRKRSARRSRDKGGAKRTARTGSQGVAAE